MKKYLEEHLDKSFIRASFFLIMSFDLFACKSKDKSQFCINYRQLNAITIKNRYPLLLIKRILEHICKAKIYNKIDIIATFNILQM